MPASGLTNLANQTLTRKMPDIHRPQQSSRRGEAWLNSEERRKRDILIASSALPIALPIGSMAVLLSRAIDGKEPISSERRSLTDTEIFTIYKIRTTSNGDTSKSNNFGKILRISGIDELPQIINILKGDMAMVGPRPLPPWEVKNMEATLPNDLFRKWKEAYNASPKGLISSYSHLSHSKLRDNHEESFKQRASLDIYDYGQASPAHDVRILVRMAYTAARTAKKAWDN